MLKQRFSNALLPITFISLLIIVTFSLSSSTLPHSQAQNASSLIESDAAQVTNNGLWTSVSASTASGNSYLYSSGSSGDALMLEFQGTSVEIIYVTNPEFGDFAIEIDNTLRRTVVTSSATTTFDNRAIIDYLEDGTHTLRVYPVSGIIAIDAFVATPVSPQIEAGRQEAAPTLNTPTGAITDPTPTFQWTEVAGSTWYRFYLTRSTGVVLDIWYDRTGPELSCNGTTCSFASPVNFVNDTYTWYIHSWGPSGYSDWGGPSTFSLNLPAPTILSKTAPADTSTVTTPTVTFEWTHDANATWYQLWVAGASTWYDAATICTATCSVNRSLSNASYIWYVQGYGPGGYGPWGTGFTFTLAIPTPGIITKTAPIGSITDPTPDFTWQADANASWYIIWIGNTSSTIHSQWYEGNAVCAGGNCSIPSPTTFVGDFSWYVRGWGPAGYGDWGTAANFSFNVTLTSPTSNIDGRNPTFTWSNLGPETTWYQLWVGPTDASSSYSRWIQSSGNCNGSSCSHSTGITLLSSKSYTWFVRPYGSYGLGGWSQGQAFGINPVVPNPTTIAGCQIFPADNIWNTPIDTLPLDPNSSLYINTIGATRGLHMDFGSGLWAGAPIGIPYIDVPSSQPLVPITFDYDDESDPGPYPIPSNAPIEGGPSSDGDRHVLVLERDNCLLYEVYYAFPQGGGTSWTAGSGAIWDLTSNTIRGQLGWTSADAAGLPILPGLVTYEEVASGEITHAIRFTVPQTRNTYVWPATHQASSRTGIQYPPMGQRFRLKPDFDISGYSPDAQVILQTMKTYGIILADNGSAWYISGAPSESWDNDVLHELDNVTGQYFEAVDVSSLMISPLSGQVQSP